VNNQVSEYHSSHGSRVRIGIGTHVWSPHVCRHYKVAHSVRIGENPEWHSLLLGLFNVDTFIDVPKWLLRYYDGTKIQMTDNVPYHNRATERLKGSTGSSIQQVSKQPSSARTVMPHFALAQIPVQIAIGDVPHA